MQSRSERQRKILNLIGKSAIDTQASLQKALSKAGFKVNQATLSRDIRELGLIKVESEGAYRYVSRETIPPAVQPTNAALATIAQFIHDITFSANIVVIKTDSGAANYVAEAIDNLKLPESLGTIAGDNTLILIVSAEAKSQQVVRDLRAMLK